MPLGIVTDAEFEAALQRCERTRETRSSSGRVDPAHGERSGPRTPPESAATGQARRPGGPIPPILKDLMAEAAIESGATPETVAEAYGVSPGSVQAFVNGRDTSGDPDPRLVKKVNETRQRIIGEAQATCLLAIGKITPEKLDDIHVRDVSAVAKDMASIIAHQEPKLIVPPTTALQAQFVFHVPEARSEADFEVLDVGGVHSWDDTDVIPVPPEG